MTEYSASDSVYGECWVEGCWDEAACGELQGKVSMHLAKQADARRRGTGYVSLRALKDAEDRIASLETALAAAQEQAKKSGAEHRAAVQTHKRLCQMLLALGKEIDLYMATEAPKDTITMRVTTERTNKVGAK